MVQKLRILLVEDEPLIYRKLTGFLEGKGHTVVRHEAKPFIDNYEDAVAAMERQIPDMALLDIKIRGDKDGLELGGYISKHYWLPVIYFTDKHEPENALAAGYHHARGFVAKIGKPPDLTQLALDIERIKPVAAALAKQKTLGDFFSVSKVDAATGKKDEAPTRKKIAWDEIIYITTEGAAKNNVLFHLADGTRWMHHEPLSSVDKVTPPFLVQFSQHQIVNIKHVDRSSGSGYRHYINNKDFEITETYRATALPLIRLFFPSL